MRMPKEYIQSLIYDDLKPTEELIREGWEIGSTFTAQRNKWILAQGCKNVAEVLEKNRKEGKFAGISINVGLPTAQETLDACLRLNKFSKENLNIEFNSGLLLPSMQVGIPKELRDPNLDTTAFMMETQEDYDMFNRPEVFMPLSNFNFVCPNAIETTVMSLKAGLTNLGTTSQLPWKYPGCNDLKKEVEDIMRAVGIVQSKKEECDPTVGCYIEDGLAASCVDVVSCVAAFLLDQYIYQELCGIPISSCFGGLIGDIHTRAALMKCLNDISTFSFMHGNTTSQWDHDVNANFASSSAETLLIMCAEDRYKTGCTLHFIPVTEAVRVPTEDELKDSLSALSRISEYVDAYRDLINWEPIEERAEILKEQGTQMFHNVLETLEDAGVDIKDPAQLISFLLNVDASLFEVGFHPTTYNGGTFEAFFPNEMGAWTLAEAEGALAELGERGYGEDTLKGKRVLVASSDVHAYGLRFIHMVMEGLGADVLDIGVECEAQTVIDFAKEEGIDLVAVSSHSGNALSVGNYLSQLSEGMNVKIIMGGTLTSILPGNKEVSDVQDLLNENERILATNNIIDQIEYLIA